MLTDSMRCGGHSLCSCMDVLVYVKKEVPTNSYSLFYDAVTLLKSLSEMHVKWSDILQDMYQA